MATGHFLAVFTLAETAGCVNSLMEKIKSLEFVFINKLPFDTADPKERLMQFFRADYVAFIADVFVRYIAGWRVSLSLHIDLVWDSIGASIVDTAGNQPS